MRLKQAVSYLSTLQIRDPHTIELPSNGSAIIPELPVLRGFSCLGCEYLTISRKKITLHARETAHGHECWRRIRLQTFSKGRYARYWIVKGDGEGDDDVVDSESAHIGDTDGDEWTDMLQQYDEICDHEREERRRIVENPTGVENVSTWVREMGWAEHFQDKDKSDIHRASLMPTSAGSRAGRKRENAEVREQEQRLTRVGHSFDRVIRRCSERLASVPHETLRWLNSIDPNKPAGDPFRMKEREDSMYRYRQFVKRYLCYCMRMLRLGRKEAEEKHGIRFTDAQWERLLQIREHVEVGSPDEMMDDATEAQEKALDRAVFNFYVQSLKQKVAFRVYVNPLLHFTAVLGINEKSGGWTEAKHFTAALAGLVWCGRLLMLEHIFEGQSDDPEEISVDMVEQFKGEYRMWLADGTHTPFSTMIRWMSYGKGHRKKEGGAAKVLWEESGEALRYLGHRIKIQEFRHAVNAGVDEAEELLDKLMFGQWAEASKMIDLHRIEDSFIYEGPDCSLATNPKNRWLQPGHRFMAQKSRATLWKLGCGWQVSKVAAYLRWLHTFKESLVVSVHVWGGQPGRGPEIMTIKHCDTQQLVRNIFVFDGQVVLITDRDKSRAIRGIGRKVARFLPERIGKMVVAYTVWLMAFEMMLHEQTRIPGPEKSLRSYMWKDARKGAWETPQLSGGLSSLTGRHLGVELMVSDYRHVAIVLGRQIKGMIIRKMEVEMGEQQDGDDVVGGDTVTGERRDQAKMEYIWDLQATHGSTMARGHYALDVRFPNQLQPEMMANYREISRLWHRFLQREGDQPEKDHRGDVTGDRKRRRGGIEDGRDITGKKRCPNDSMVSQIERGLRRLIGEHARWKTEEQGEAMEKVMSMTRRETLIVVLPTGGGKSVLFMLPALIESSGTSIVVVPFTALIDDLVDRARKSGVDCVRWMPAVRAGRDEQERVARVVVVSADVVGGPEFAGYADGLRARGLLKRIFVDEGHTIVMDVAYRTELEKVSGLHRYDCAVILLTATLPIRIERWFRRSMLAESASMIRAGTTKRNIRYNVIRTARSSEVVDEVVRVVLKLEKTMYGDHKGVVYCRSRASCERLAEKLGCDFYHSGIADGARRQAILRAWSTSAGGNRWIVATTGLGTGIDIPGIVGVVHMEQPYGLVDFVQQTGRGGRREGEIVESVVVMDQGKAWFNPSGGDVEHLNHQAMEWFVESVDCRRVILGTFMDGDSRDCEELGCELCDRCRANNIKAEVGDQAPGQEKGELEEGEDEDEDQGLSMGSDRLKERVRERATGLIRMRQGLEDVGDDCPVCWVKWHQFGCRRGWRAKVEHAFRDCRVIRYQDFEVWRRKVEFGAYGCCWRCGLPQLWCAGWQGGDCEHIDKVMPVMMMVWQSGTLRGMVQEAFKVEFTSDETYIRWIGRSRRIYGECMTNGLAVWDLIVKWGYGMEKRSI